MAKDKKLIFREKSLDRISSPEELDQYLQVTKPKTWIVLGAIVILLIGIISWGFFGRLTTKITVAVSVEKGRAICYIPEIKEQNVEIKEIHIGDESYSLYPTGLVKLMVNDNLPSAVKECGHLINGEVVFPLGVNGELVDGIYQGEIIIEQVRPIHFLMN
ncbi:MAG: hypothetical protein Q4E53_05275 [Eubacteriales bacterium]|nr:hypothetical protein [Eubacteriales bacterium]